MIVTEVRIHKPETENDPSNRLLAFAAVTFDKVFVVHDCKIVEGEKGVFVGMPTRRSTDKCQQCRGKNTLTAAFCNWCGIRLDPDRAFKFEEHPKLYQDICHPIDSPWRRSFQNAVLSVYEGRSNVCLSGGINR